MAKTKAQLATAVLRRLKIIGAEETADADDSNLVQDIYGDKLEELYDLELAYWAEDEIPDEVYRIIVTLIANEVAPEFHQQFSPDLEVMYMNKLRIHISKKASGEPIQAVYY